LDSQRRRLAPLFSNIGGEETVALPAQKCGKGLEM
jgi:hypothetical protein